MDYGCPKCSRTIVKSEEPITATFTAKCPRCREIVELERTGGGRPMHRVYRCSNEDCSHEVRTERPVADRKYCVMCGTDTLEDVTQDQQPGTTPASSDRYQTPGALPRG